VPADWQPPIAGQHAPRPGQPPQAPKRKKRGVRAAVISSVSLVVVAALAAGVFVTVHRGTGCDAATSYTECGRLAHGSAYPDPLFNQMASDMQAHNEAAFLGNVAASAKPALRSWYQNMLAIGFDAVVIRSNGSNVVPVDSQGNGTIQVAAGARSPLDPEFAVQRDATASPKASAPVIPAESYQVTFHETGFGKAPEITGWQTSANAPWDLGVSLYVRRGGNVTVVGYPDEKTLVSQTVPMAEAAASYDLGFFRKFLPQAVQQSGFVVFVSADASRRETWFNNGQQVTGWPADPDGLTVPMIGITSAASSTFDTIGAARVVITPQSSASAETATLVSEFTHDILISNDIAAGADALWSFGTNDQVPTWAIEGAARFVESLYLTNPGLNLSSYPDLWLPQELVHFPTSQLPSAPPPSSDFSHGSASSINSAYNVAASIYLYIAEKYGGIGDALDTALKAYLADNSPVDDVVVPGSNNRQVSASVIEQAWPAWFKATYH
jgi:hypothetical protein